MGRRAGGWHASSKKEIRTARLVTARQRFKARHGRRCDFCRWRVKRRRDLRWLDVHETAGGSRPACKWCHGMLSNGKRPDPAHSRAARRARRIP